eukprot:9971402-Lingulodinium_polyedra.AAC.1
MQLEATLGFRIAVRHAFACEKMPDKRAFIAAHFRPEAVFRDIIEIGDSSVARDELSGEMKTVVAPH